MSNSNGMYSVLNIFKKLVPTQEQTVKAEAQRIYESVEAKGSILEGVKSTEKKLQEKYQIAVFTRNTRYAVESLLAAANLKVSRYSSSAWTRPSHV